MVRKAVKIEERNMAFTVGLYYPWIDVRSEGWLKTACLYWDKIRTVVPQSMDSPYSSVTARQLQEAGILVPLRVNPEMVNVLDLTDKVVGYVNLPETRDILFTRSRRKGGRERHSDYPMRMARMSPEKFSNEVRYIVERELLSKEHEGFYEVDERFANYYMTILATTLSEQMGAGLLTDSSIPDTLALTLRTGLPSPRRSPERRHHHYWDDEPLLIEEVDSRNVGQGMLANMIIERLSIDPTTEVDRIIKFREDHSSELGRFRTKVAELTSSIPENMPPTALRQRILDIYRNEVLPAADSLKQALIGSRINWLGEGLLKISLLSAGSTSMLYALGFSGPSALLAGAGVSLTIGAIRYHRGRKDALAQNPYSYLLSLERLVNRNT